MGRRVTGRIIPPGAPEFVALFDTFTDDAFQLETLQDYRAAGEDDDVAAFLSGAPAAPAHGHDAWLDMVRRNTSAGRTMRRVHVLVEPLSDYARYELCWPYASCTAAGEDIRIVPVIDPHRVPAGGDWWLFDGARLFQQHHGVDGRWMGTEPVDDWDVAARRVRDALWQVATPWADYVGARPELAARVSSRTR